MLVEKADRSKGSIRFHDKDVLHIRSITKRDPLLCKTVIDLVFHLVDHDDGVCGHPALDLQKKRGFDLFTRQTRSRIVPDGSFTARL